ncbi:MAG TPA: PspC domain-containing protein [Steroidobacter sp.]|jgi:phage shock protein PspC (stress-responsive transcriptional regulator)|nr:PspC domain-containing protein [Steroidobacter sp.]
MSLFSLYDRYATLGRRFRRTSPMVNIKGPLRRSRSNRLIAGVVAGLANYLGIDVTLARVLYAVISILSAAFPGILIYIILWIVIPEESG